MVVVLGIGLLMPNPESARLIIFGIAFPLMVCVFLIVVFQPKWFKPKWVQWLEENHGDILELLIEESRQSSDWRDWAKRVSTQAGLEAWVAEVRHKHHL
jgi:hypothetical protein